MMQFVRGFGQFWWDFIVGDDPILAIGVVLVLATARVLEQSGLQTAAWLIGPIGIFVILAFSLARATSATRGVES